MTTIDYSTVYNVEPKTNPTNPTELREALDAIGYRIDADACFSYVNGSNPGPAYKARSITYVEKDTGRSAYNFESRRDDNFLELQRIRWHCEFTYRGRVWEL